MSLQVITINHNEKWDSIVRSFENYDIYYLNGYSKSFQLHGDGDPQLIYFENNQIKAINVVMKRDIADCPFFESYLSKSEWFDYSTPYGYGGFILEGLCTQDNIHELNQEYTSYCIDNNIVSEFVRFHPIINNSFNCSSIYNVENLGLTISLDLSSNEIIWNNICSKNRNLIRKAQKENVKIYWGCNKDLIDNFIEIYNRTMDRKNADIYYYFEPQFYDCIIDDLKYNSLIFYAMKNSEIIAMSVILLANKKMHYHLSASKIEYLQYAPTNLMLYEAACWGCYNGYKTFHLGGGLGCKEDSLFKFKKAFNKSTNNNFIIGKKIFDTEKYNDLVLKRSKEKISEKETIFFPAYRVK